MKFSFLRILSEEKGASAVIVGILMIVFIGFAALVIDIGHLYEVRRQLQSAADAASMAGAQEVINGGDESQVLSVAQNFAQKNDFPQDKGTPKVLEMVFSPSELTQVTDEYVKVTVKKSVDFFFAPVFELIFNDSFKNKIVYAQARAQVVYVTGGKGLVPWGVNIIRASKVVASVESGGTSELFYNPATGKWEGSLALPSVPSTSGYPVTLTVYNSQQTADYLDGFPETLSPAQSIGIHQATDPIWDVYFSDNYVSAGDSVYLYVQSATEPRARVGNVNYNFTQVSPNLYRAAVTAPSTVNVVDKYPVEVTAGSGNNAFVFSNAAVLVVRRSTYPIKKANIGMTHLTAGSANATMISVELNEFVYGEEYDLKLVAGAEAGNFNALDFRYVTHPDGTQEGLSNSAADYYDNIIYYPGEIHIGDIIATKTGNLSGHTTSNSINTRINNCTYTFETWRDAGKPADCGRIIIIPVVEKIERITGQSDVIVESLAAFFIEDYEIVNSDRTNITGRFIEYVKPGTYSISKPNSNFYLQTVRLAKTDF